jgi:serine/threonine-protein kinase
MTLAGRVFSNRYAIQREVAQGGMAEVYLAHDQLLDRPVALKALFPEYAREPSFVERFRREAQAAANLNHPNIVAIYDWGQEAGTYFIVMEYVEGRSLRDLIRSEAPVDPNQAAEITGEIASALAFAHRSGVVHRDVKPGNVLLTRSGNVKVTDFGIARAGASDGLTQTGSVMGTATYFSPEQAQGLPVDGRSDVYALGVVLYEMVCGVPPFTGDSPVAVAYKHVREDPIAPSERNPEVPPDLEQIIMTSLAKDPEQRYQTADDMRADLLRFRRGRPLAAAPVTAIVAEVPTTATQAATRAQSAYAAAATIATPRVDDRGRQTDAPVYTRRKRKTALITTAIIILLIAVLGGIFWAATQLGSSEAKVVVPDVRGRNLLVAINILKQQHLSYRQENVTSDRPVGTVVDQDPKPDTKATKNSTVKLMVSAGAQQVQVPTDIRGKNVLEATAELQGLGFVVKADTQTSDTVDKNRVIDSTPPPGQNAPKGGTVTLLVSSGPAPVEIPDVSGQTRDQAGQTLGQKGFKNIVPQNESSATIPAGQVTRTDPPAGQKIPVDQQITLFVSTGPPTKTVPSELGSTVDAAKADLAAKGFTNVSTVNKVDPNNVGVVIDMSPNAGAQIQAGDRIVLTVGVASAASTTTTT